VEEGLKPWFARTVEFAVLGPLEVRLDGRSLALGGPKQRAVLAILLLRANRSVARERLIDGLWEEWPPSAAQRSIDSYVSRLRALLGKDRLVRTPAGYTLRVEAGELDLDRFEILLDRGLLLSTSGDAERVVETLREALGLWRGPALADLTTEPFARKEVERLEERRLLAIEELNEARFVLGQGAALVPELTRLVAEHPLRERLLGQLMLALYRGGRQAEALGVFQRGRQRLADELGLDPAPQLRELERRILEQDPALAAPSPTSRRAAQPRRRRVLVAAGAATAVLAAAIAAILVEAGGGGATRTLARTSEVVGLSASSGRGAGRVPLVGAPAAMAAGARSLWIADADAGTVSRVDLSNRSLVDRVAVGGSPGTLAVGGGFIWAASVPGAAVSRIDPATGTVTQTIGLGGARAAALAYGRRGLWVADTTDDSLIEVDPDTGGVRRTIRLDVHPTALAVGRGAIWVADYATRTVEQVDSASGQTLAKVTVGNGPAALAVTEDAVWVANALDSTVSRIDPVRGSVVSTIPVGSGPTALALTPGSVWVANRYSATVSRIDAGRHAIVDTVPVGGQPSALATSDGKLWVGVSPIARHRGGTLRLLHTRPLLIDPALQADLPPPQSDGLTTDGLVSFNHVSGAAGVQLVPDLALSLPAPTSGETTYTFRLRPGIRYSDGRLVRARDFRRAIERVFNLRSYGSDVLRGIRGADDCLRPHRTTCDLAAGILTDDAARTVTFRLESPDPNFLVKLTIGGLASPAPPATPPRTSPARPIPGTGPYKIVRANRREIRYVRNPYFREWSHAAQPAGNPDEIVWRFGLSPAEEVRAIERGEADWMADTVPGSLLAGLAARRAGQLHTFATTETDFFQLNTTLPPFDDVRVRQALNLAVDRRAVVRIYGGRLVATATCQVLPPGIAGYRRYCPYLKTPGADGSWSAPDLARARRLVSASGTRGARVTVWGWTDDPTISPRVVTYVADVLRGLGYRARVRLVAHGDFDRLPAAVRHAVQLIPAGWLDVIPYNFISPWFSCDGARTHGNFFCDRSLDRYMVRAQALEAGHPRAAASLWARIDRELVDRAAWVPLVNGRQIDFVSSRVTSFQHHPYWDILADQLELR
jgi:DNA-binding SARP family transcriptional activator/ABC-type transport system substrate-binding protein